MIVNYTDCYAVWEFVVVFDAGHHTTRDDGVKGELVENTTIYLSLSLFFYDSMNDSISNLQHELRDSEGRTNI